MTKKTKQWFQPGAPSGWKKSQPAAARRSLVLKAHGGDYLASARAKQALANVTRDPETERKSQADAEYFFRKYHEAG